MSVMQMLSRVGIKTVKFDVGRGGKADLTPEDLIMHFGMAEAAGKLSEIAAMFALAYYTNIYNDSSKDLIHRFLCVRVYLKAQKEKVRIKQSTIKRIVDLALRESINSVVCPVCRGEKKVLMLRKEFDMKTALVNATQNDSKYKTCKSCKGSGYKLMTNYKKAVACEMSGSGSWTSNHELLLSFAQQVITDWNKEISQSLSTIYQ